MYEAQTYEQILGRMLERIRGLDPRLDTREGSVLWLALAPAAVELAVLYTQADAVLAESFADTETRDFLIRRCAERGIRPESAYAAVWRGAFVPGIYAGARFSADKLNFIAEERLDAPEGATEPGEFWRLRCETPGLVGNSARGDLIPIEYVPGLRTAELLELLIPGEDEEDTEALRQRYFRSFDAQAFGGNVADYKEKIHAMQGIGGCKVWRAWQGGGTVRVVIQNSLFAAPTPELVAAVQEALDPEAVAGEGLGLAPIGHAVTVVGVAPVAVDSFARFTLAPGLDWETVLLGLRQAAETYFLELAKSWEDGAPIVVRISHLETRFLSVPGIVDLTGTTLQGLEENLTLSVDAIPVCGTLSGQVGGQRYG